jgi:hypothetical protein
MPPLNAGIWTIPGPDDEAFVGFVPQQGLAAGASGIKPSKNLKKVAAKSMEFYLGTHSGQFF